ncbi:MAG: DNA/RNA nuclease SfsA [Christensenellales bacterium]|jgi:sugar fermentation stimulation protein A
MSVFYEKVLSGRFIERPNRFIARVAANGQEVAAHVKNTGRCRELLLPGSRVILSHAAREGRKTDYDLVAVYKGDMLVNIDSQAPNAIAQAYLRARFPGATIRREAAFGHSRLDFHVQDGDMSLYAEVKGCTLEENGLALFPDAPTQRGIRHLNSLMDAVMEGHGALALFIIQMRPVRAFSPHDRMHPAFGQALRAAAAAGVEVAAIDCYVREDGMAPGEPVPVVLSGDSST